MSIGLQVFVEYALLVMFRFCGLGAPLSLKFLAVADHRYSCKSFSLDADAIPVGANDSEDSERFPLQHLET